MRGLVPGTGKRLIDNTLPGTWLALQNFLPGRWMDGLGRWMEGWKEGRMKGKKAQGKALGCALHLPRVQAGSPLGLGQTSPLHPHRTCHMITVSHVGSRKSHQWLLVGPAH